VSWEIGYVLALAVATLVFLVTGRVRIDAIGLLLMVALVAAGVLPYDDAVAGLGNKAILTIAGLYVVGEGLTRTGALEFIARALLRASLGRTRRVILLTGAVAALASSFLNDTAVVVVLLPILLEISRTTGIPASHLLMPMSFCALLGGMNTLIGTSTNLLVSGVAETLDQAPIGMFEMTAAGVLLTVAGLLYLTLFSRRILPVRTSFTALTETGAERSYVTEIVIGPTSALRGRSYEGVFTRVKAELLFFVRDEELMFPPFGDRTIEAEDVIMLRGDVDAIVDVQRELDLRYAAGIRTADRELSFFEVSIAPHSPLVGRRARELEMWRDFGAVTVAILRAGQHVRQRVSDMPLRAGDLLLVLGNREAQARVAASNDFHMVGRADGAVKLRAHGGRALAIAGGVVTLLASSSILGMKALPVPFVALLGALAMIATGCVTPRRVYRTIDWPVLLFIAGTIALGEAMERTGAANLVAQAIVHVASGWGDAALLSALLLLCIVLNMLIAHAAVAVLLTPVAISSAHALAAARGLPAGDPHADALVRGCVLAIAFGGSLCFATPAGHQVNLMVMGPGGYRYGDYLRLGLPLSLIAWLVLSFTLPRLVGL
jgi:di/tricarboxylate transporter